MQDQTITLVLAGGDGEKLQPLTYDRPKALVPFGGLFRILDFAVSSVLNSQLRHIHVLPLSMGALVQEYIREGWPILSADFRWDQGEDLTCHSPATGSHYQGTADAVFRNLSLVEKSRAKHILIVPGDQIHLMDYARLLRHHVESQTDLTTAVQNVYVFNRETLISALKKHVAAGDHSCFEDHIVPMIASTGRATFYNCNEYVRTISTLDDYHAASMDFANDRTGFDAYSGPASVRTLSGPRQLQQSRYSVNSKVALGARLISCKVWSSVISAGVRVAGGTEIENSVILNGSTIGSGSRLRNVIVPEKVTIPPGTQIGFDVEADRARYLVTAEGIVVVSSSGRSKHQYIQRRCARVATKAHILASR